MVELNFFLYLNYLFDKINLSKLSVNNLNKLDLLGSNYWMSKILDHMH